MMQQMGYAARSCVGYVWAGRVPSPDADSSAVLDRAAPGGWVTALDQVRLAKATVGGVGPGLAWVQACAGVSGPVVAYGG